MTGVVPVYTLRKRRMKSKPTLTVICEHCEHVYTRPIAINKHRQDLILDFSVCPNCKTPRLPTKIAKYVPEDLCVHCGLPQDSTGNQKAGRGLCYTCYRADDGKIRKRYPVKL